MYYDTEKSIPAELVPVHISGDAIGVMVQADTGMVLRVLLPQTSWYASV